MSKQNPKILLVEDDLSLGILLVDLLESEGYEVKLCKDGEVALKSFNEKSYDLCLLDVMLPKADGFTIAKSIRKVNIVIPVIFITAMSLKADKLKAYNLGADDYITKPFDEEELLWKIKAIVRRMPIGKQNESVLPISIGKYLFDFSNQSLSINGQEKRITKKEAEILLYFCNNSNKVIKREELLLNLWGKNDYFLGRSLDLFITKLRKHLKDDTNLRIENVFRVGFIFVIKN